jgi:hypothetical protein
MSGQATRTNAFAQRESAATPWQPPPLPDGLEAAINKEQMSDLLAFLLGK